AFDSAKGVQWVFCRTCHAVHELPLSRKVLSCRCGTRTSISDGPLQSANVRCPQCRAVHPLVALEGDNAGPPRHRLFAQEYLIPDNRRMLRRFKAATEADNTRYREAANAFASLPDSTRSIV